MFNLMTQAGTKLLRVLQVLDRKEIVGAKPPEPYIKCAVVGCAADVQKAGACPYLSFKNG